MFFLPSYSDDSDSSRYDKQKENAQPRKFKGESPEHVPVGGANTKQETAFGKIGRKGKTTLECLLFW